MSRPSIIQAKNDLRELLDRGGFQVEKVVERAVELWRGYAAQVVRRDPFKLMTNKVISCGFRRCDKLWQKLKLPRANLKRLALCIWSGLRDRGGDTWHVEGVAVEIALRETNDLKKVRRAILLARRAGILKATTERRTLYLAVAEEAACEERLAERIKQISRWRPNDRS